MKKIFIAALLTVFMAMSGVALAQTQDMAKVKCSEFIQGDNNVRTYIVFWLDGYMSAESENTEMSDEWVKKLSTHMGTFCAQNPNKTIMEAAEAIPE